jgi:hypothetical protein
MVFHFCTPKGNQMLKKSITFDDLDGNPVTEDFYFNLTKAELAELDIETTGGMAGVLEKLSNTNNGPTIIRLFRDIIGRSVGMRSEDGRRLLKNQQIRDEFMSSEAYSALFMELIEAPDSGASFFVAIVPKDLQEQVQENAQPTTDVALPEVPAWIAENREPTSSEMQSMTKEQMVEVFQRRTSAGKPAIVPAQPEVSGGNGYEGS